jgi:hypothetical protein
LEDPSPLRRIYLGRVTLAQPVVALCRRLDRALEAVCAVLPPPLRPGAHELLASYGRRSADAAGAEPSFFHHFYSPLWSWIYWAATAPEVPEVPEMGEVVAGQAMAMFLHLLDDHLCDGQLRCQPLLLQLRTAAWLKMEQCAQALAKDSASAKELWQSDISRYFAAIHRPPPRQDLDGYCAHFRDQMATCVAFPALTLRWQGTPEAAEDLCRIVYGLGIAWRLVDDVQDAYADWLAGHESILYILLRAQPDFAEGKGPPGDSARLGDWTRVAERLFRSGIVKVVLGRCSAELLHAAELAESRAWVGLSHELRQLRHPIADLLQRLP